MRRKVLISGIVVLTLALGALIYSRSGGELFGLSPAASTQSNVSAQPIETPVEKIVLAAPGH